MLNGVMYKFMWNRHFKAAKAPERINREIINKPISLGGFGMLDLIALDRSLKLKALGRTFVSRHPFCALVKQALDMSRFFFPNVTLDLCGLTNKAVDILKQVRQDALQNQALMNNVKFLCLIKDTPIKMALTAAGLS